MANLLHIKGSRTQVLSSFPTRSFGKDGDIVISRINGKGTYLCSKAAGTWYTANKLQELSKFEKTSIRDLSVSKLSVNSMINASDKADKFLVNNNNQIQYRTGSEIIGDLDIFESDINYKTAYCSLGQYTDKESCEDGGGRWYYSENDSHDSISSTAENQLLTVGQSIGNLDAEPTLLYDGSTLEIKYNSDYDDNWQTAATDARSTNLLKLSYDSSNNAIFDVNSSGVLLIDSSGDITLNADGGKTYFKDAETLSCSIISGVNNSLSLYNSADSGDFFKIATGSKGVTTLSTTDNGGAAGHLTLQPDGDLKLDPASQKTIINATDGLYFDGGGDTYITESSADVLDFIVGGVQMMRITESGADILTFGGGFSIPATKRIGFDGGLTGTYITESADDVMDIVAGGDRIIQLSEKGDDGNEVNFGSSCAGFTQLEPTYDATTTIVDFRHSNKQFLTFDGGNITDVVSYFPLVSGNFVLLLKQDGTGSRTVTNWKAGEFDESAADGSAIIVWAGGSAPTLTTDANHVDILSFYWDADNEIAYGVATLDFQF